MSDPVPQPSPEILALLESCNEFIETSDVRELAARALRPDRYGTVSQPSENELEAVYELARQLCEQEKFQFAAGIALHLFSYRPTDPRFAFLAGNCAQRLGLHSSAVRLFCCSLMAGGDHPAALFRLGESLLALGDTSNADKAFDAALDVSRAYAEAEEIQTASHEMLRLVRKSQHSSVSSSSST